MRRSAFSAFILVALVLSGCAGAMPYVGVASFAAAGQEGDQAAPAPVYYPAPLVAASAEQGTQDEQNGEQTGQESDKALQEMLRESPMQSEENLKHDIEELRKLTPAQNEAINDGMNGVVLTQGEKKALRSISVEQWHALSQTVASYQWVQDKKKEANDGEQAARNEAEREQDRERLAMYQYLMTQAAMRQANAAQRQAARPPVYYSAPVRKPVVRGFQFGTMFQCREY